MTNKNIVLRVIYTLMALIAVISVIFYFILEPDKPWTAFYVACCGGVLVINLLISSLFVQRNFKK